MATLTSEAKQLLAKTIRELRTRLLRDLHDAADGRYRLSLPIEKAKLAEEPRKKRERLDAWLDERVRTANPKNDKETSAARARFLLQAEKEAAATVLNRMVLLRHLEALGLSRPAVVTGGWNSKGYKELRDFAPALTGDETEGYSALLQLVFDELALDLPGLFGDVGLVRLFPLPAATLREVVEKLDDPILESAWTDDTTLGWVYQYWNDPEREALDDKIADGGKIEPYEIASKTQMFTERYMVEWLLHNSLGLTWLCMCKKQGWTADAEAVLPVLDARRADWRKKREAGEVALDALMPIHGELEEHWKYYVPQPIPEEAVANAPDSIHTLKLLDPACGSGHFLVIAFDLLAAMYREEARHRGHTITGRQIAESILENNLHGIDIDPRAVQIAAAAVVLKAKRLSHEARPKRVNLVAPVLRLGELQKSDPALVRLRHELKQEAGIPEELTQRLIESLAGVDYLGSLLKVDGAIDDAIRAQEQAEAKLNPSQGDLLSGRFAAQQAQIDWTQARVTLLDRLEEFLAGHTGDQDLGLRLDGEQLAAGIRFVRLVKEGSYDVVAGNPPYQGLSKTKSLGYVASRYPSGKADLYAVFLLRALELLRPAGASALVTMRGWMFQNQLRELRKWLLRENDLRALVDLDAGAFDEVSAAQVVLSVACSVFLRIRQHLAAVALRPTPIDDRASIGMTARKRAGLLLQVARYDFDPRNFGAIDGEPIVYWWTAAFLAKYAEAPKLGEVSPARATQGLYNNGRFTRYWHEVRPRRVSGSPNDHSPWTPFANGSDGAVWFDPIRLVALWGTHGFEAKTYVSTKIGSDIFRFANEQYFFNENGVAFATIGAAFNARAVRHRGIFGNKGRCVFSTDRSNCLCLLNSRFARETMQSLNPGVGFEAGDVNRIAALSIPDATSIDENLWKAFVQAEAVREGSVRFCAPGSSPWTYAQDWAQRAVDRADRDPLSSYEPVYEQPSSADFVSFGIGVALGRFGANEDGVLETAPDSALPAGVLFVSAAGGTDSLKHAACARLNAIWDKHSAADGSKDDLRTYLLASYFKHHKAVYESRPIYFPLSSSKRNFVAWVSIHRWDSRTLATLLADHLIPARRDLEGELVDLRNARTNPEKAGKVAIERRFAEVQKLLTELIEFIDKVVECAEHGPPPTTANETPREQNARYEMDLDDGVMVNAAALWPLLEPQWKDPKKWWHELAEAKGRKDYDWSHLAKRYFPKRVEAKCVVDPSLAVAHGCFWRLHPAKAYAWELRLQDEIRPDFTIDEEGSDAARERWLSEHAREAEETRATEKKRRERKAAKAEKGEDDADQGVLQGHGFDGGDGDEEGAVAADE